MSKLLVLIFLGVSLASIFGEPFQPQLLRQHMSRWAEQTLETAVAEVRETSSRLQRVADLAGDPKVHKLGKLYEENSHFLRHCDFMLTEDPSYRLQGLPSCLNITGDIANFTIFAIYGYQLADEMADAVVDVLNEFNTCPNQPNIWSQYKCYKHAFEDIQSDIKEYSTDCKIFLSNATVVLRDIEVDVKNCLSVSEKFSMESVESMIELCKLNLKE